MARRQKEYVGLRNVIIHEYLEVDYEKMYQAIKGLRDTVHRMDCDIEIALKA